MSSIEASNVKKICLACEAGAGSSLMVKNSLIKKAKKAGLDIEIVHSPATQIPADTDIVVTHQGVAGGANSAAPENAVLMQRKSCQSNQSIEIYDVIYMIIILIITLFNLNI